MTDSTTTPNPASLIVRRVLAGDCTLDAAVSAMRAQNAYAACYMEYTAPDLAVTWTNRQPRGPHAAQYAAEWAIWQQIQTAARAQSAPARSPRPAAPAPRYICPSCGEDRDTTRPGHCDDCEA